MTAWNQWAQNALVMNLGWALLAFVWQGAVIGLAAGLLLKLLQHRSPDVRYAVSLGCLLVAIACPFATFFAMQSSVSRVDHELSPVPSPEVISRVESQPSTRKLAVNVARQESSSIDRPQANVAVPATTSPKTAFAFNLPPRLPGAAVGLWMAGVVFLAVRLAGVLWLTRRTLCRSTLPLRGEWVRIAERLARQIGVHRAVRWLESASIDVPLTVGWLWPVVVVPTSILSGLSPAEIECLLAHELVHVRRHDYIVNLLQTGAEILLFYHPVVWWLSRQIRHERELICDARAAAAMGDPLVYSRALLKVATLACPSTPALAATGGILQKRIAILLGIAPHRGHTSGWLVVGLVATLLIGGISCALLIMPDRDVDASSHLVADAEDQGGIPSVRLIKGQHSIGPVSGRVRTPKGEPVAGAQVWIRERTTRRQSWGKLPGRPAQSADLARTTTDADGRYSFAVVPLPSDTGDSVWLDVVVQATDHAIGWKYFDFPRDAQNADVVLRTPHAITGQIVDQAGNPIAHAAVGVKHLMSIRDVALVDLDTDRWPRIDDPKFVDLAWFSEAPTTTADAAGRFELSALPPDSGVVIDVVHARFVVANVFAATVGELDSVNAAHLKRPVQTGAVKVVLAPGRTLNVHVVFDDTGGAAVGARYSLPPIVHPPSRTVGLDGSFALTSLHVSNVDLFVYPPVGSDYLAQSQTIKFPADVYEMEHTIRLVRGAIVSGKVMDSVTSAGIAHARLIPAGAFLPHDKAHYSCADYPIKTAADGSFRAAVVPGSVRLWVQGLVRGYRTEQLPAGASILDLQAGTLVTTSLDQPVEGLVLTLQPAPIVRGTVVDPQRRPTAGVAISTKLRGAWSWDKLWRTDDAGRFLLDYLYCDIADEAEPIPVVFHDSSSNSGTIVWLDPPGDELNREIEVQLRPLGELIGRIIDDDTGRPVAGTRVQLYMQRPGGHKHDYYSVGSEVLSGRDGRFVLPGVFPDVKCYPQITDGRYFSFDGKDVLHTGVTGQSRDVGDVRLVPTTPSQDAMVQTFRAPSIEGLSPDEAFERLLNRNYRDDEIFQRHLKIVRAENNANSLMRLVARRDPTPAYAAAFADLAADNPETEVEFQSLLWIAKTPLISGSSRQVAPFLQAASQRLLDRYIDRSELGDCIQTIAWYAEQKPMQAYERLYRQSPHRKVKGQARFAAACRIVTDHPAHDPVGDNRDRAIQLFQEVIDQFADLRDDRGGTLGSRAAQYIDELQKLTNGVEAPDIVGTDVNGQPLKLSDFRGRAVVLVFWGSWCGPCIADLPELQQLQSEFGESVAVIGVMSDTLQDARQSLEQHQARFPNFVDGRTDDGQASSGSIVRAWNVDSWPTKYILDTEGVIRFKRVQTSDLRDTVRQALQASEAKTSLEQARRLLVGESSANAQASSKADADRTPDNDDTAAELIARVLAVNSEWLSPPGGQYHYVLTGSGTSADDTSRFTCRVWLNGNQARWEMDASLQNAPSESRELSYALVIRDRDEQYLKAPVATLLEKRQPARDLQSFRQGLTWATAFKAIAESGLPKNTRVVSRTAAGAEEAVVLETDLGNRRMNVGLGLDHVNFGQVGAPIQKVRLHIRLPEHIPILEELIDQDMRIEYSPAWLTIGDQRAPQWIKYLGELPGGKRWELEARFQNADGHWVLNQARNLQDGRTLQQLVLTEFSTDAVDSQLFDLPQE